MLASTKLLWVVQYYCSYLAISALLSFLRYLFRASLRHTRHRVCDKVGVFTALVTRRIRLSYQFWPCSRDSGILRKLISFDLTAPSRVYLCRTNKCVDDKDGIMNAFLTLPSLRVRVCRTQPVKSAFAPSRQRTTGGHTASSWCTMSLARYCY